MDGVLFFLSVCFAVFASALMSSPELGTKQRKREDRVAATFNVDCFFFFNAQ